MYLFHRLLSIFHYTGYNNRIREKQKKAKRESKMENHIFLTKAYYHPDTLAHSIYGHGSSAHASRPWQDSKRDGKFVKCTFPDFRMSN